MQRRYTLRWRADADDPPGGVAVQADVPDGWQEEITPTGGPRFRIEGFGGAGGPAIVMIHAPGDSAKARLDWAIGQQFDVADLGAARREDRADGRVWIEHRRRNGFVHARMFVPAPAVGGVVMATVMLSQADAAELDRLRAFFESVHLAS
jgi:hypothetical protein